MYKLTLTADERQAIDWVGDRYSHGDDLFRLLYGECEQESGYTDWDEPIDITFLVPEHVAWEISEIIDEGLDCFSGELCSKLYHFQEKIV